MYNTEKSKDWQKYRQQVALLSVRSTGKMLVYY